MKPSLRDILHSALEVTKINKEDWELFKYCRLQQVIHTKRLVALIASEYGYNHKEIASILGIDRSTVHHHIKIVKDLYSLYEDAKEMVDITHQSIEKKMGKESVRELDAWLSRSKNGILIISPSQPEKMGSFWVAEGSKPFRQEAFPQVTYDSGPIKVKVRISIDYEKM